MGLQSHSSGAAVAVKEHARDLMEVVIVCAAEIRRGLLPSTLVDLCKVILTGFKAQMERDGRTSLELGFGWPPLRDGQQFGG